MPFPKPRDRIPTSAQLASRKAVLPHHDERESGPARLGGCQRSAGAEFQCRRAADPHALSLAMRPTTLEYDRSRAREWAAITGIGLLNLLELAVWCCAVFKMPE